MKIGIIIDELISGGFQKVAVMEAKYFQKLGHNVTLIVLHRTKDEGYADLIEGDNIRVLRLSDKLPVWLRINFRFPFFAFFSYFHIFYPFFIWKYMEEKNFDFFVVHGTYTAFSAISFKKKLGVPCISFIHDSITYIIENKYKERFFSSVFIFLIFTAKKIDCWIIRNSDYVIAFPDMITEMKKNFPDYKNYREILNGCEILPTAKIDFTKENFALAVTKWDQGKNFKLLLDVWERLNTKISLKVIGSFHPVELEGKTRDQIKKRRLKDVIELVGKVTEKELREYYQKARFLVHPCREAFGMTILEASANGCPAIFTNNSGVAGLFPEDLVSLLPDENDEKGYVDAINDFVSLNEGKYRELINDYHEVAVENSWENHCKSIEKLVIFGSRR